MSAYPPPGNTTPIFDPTKYPTTTTIISSQWSQNGSNIFYTNGNVGIGKTNPSQPLDVSGNLRMSNIVDAANNTGSSTNILTKLSGNTVWSYSQAYLRGNDMFPQNTVDTSTISGLSSNLSKWQGACLASNGKIYCCPNGIASVLVIDPATDTIQQLSITLPVVNAWAGCVFQPATNKVYFIPFSASYVLILDIITNTFDTTSITGLIGANKWIGGVVVGNRIFCIPSTANNILIINTTNNTTSTITGYSGSGWIGGCLASNNKIYCCPSTASSVLIIDTVALTADTTTITVTGSGNQWIGGVLAPNGNMYCMPFNATSILVINPITNTASYITGLSGASTYASGTLASNGLIYCSSWNANNIMIINPSTNTYDITTITITNPGAGWYGSILAPNNKIYQIPYNATAVNIIKTGLPTQQPWMMAPEFNKL